MKAALHILSAVLFLLIVSKASAQTENNYYVQGSNNRLAAEWEPALGTMIVWPLSIPHKLVIELAKDNHLFTLVENDSARAIAATWYATWGIGDANNTFVFVPKGIDSWWVRDWGPGAVFTPQGKMKLADGKYIYSTPVSDIGCSDTLNFIYMTDDKKIIKTETDDNATVPFGKGLGMDVLDLPFISTGGNVLTDGLGTALSTCILLNENKLCGIENEKFFDLNKKMLGLKSYHVISNFEDRGIQHIDCLLKILDEERILVAEPPADHEFYPVYENIVQHELSKLRTPYGRPYEILRLKTVRYKGQALAVYTNSIIINKTIYVPLFQINEDQEALQRWKDVMPGYVVKGFDFLLANEPVLDPKAKEDYNLYGWKNGDALHCRTRAVWDPKVIFITAKKIHKTVDSKHKHIVYTSIIDYSGQGLARTERVWRTTGSANWNHTPLSQVKDSNNYWAEIRSHKQGTSVEYYISAASKSGRTETKPRTAPAGFYTFLIN